MDTILYITEKIVCLKNIQSRSKHFEHRTYNFENELTNLALIIDFLSIRTNYISEDFSNFLLQRIFSFTTGLR